MKTLSLLVGASAATNGYQIFFPVGREEETVAYSYLDIIPSTTYQLCSWFKSFNSQGQIIHLSVDDEDSKYFSLSINGNKLQIETEQDVIEPNISADVKTDLGIELNDYRWHQVCVSCSGVTCRTVLDNKSVENLKTNNLIEPLAGNYRKLVIGDFNFGGKVQDLEFGFGKNQRDLSSKTVCGVEYKTVHEDLSKFKIFPEDLWITRPIHIRDREVVCNDLLSVDCGIDSIFVSISHQMLKSVGEQYPINRLGLTKSCRNETLDGYTTFAISPPEACGGDGFAEQNDNVVRNSIFSLAADGQVFTADFSCRYPIDVTVVDRVSPALPSTVTNSRNEKVELGLVRYESTDYKKLSSTPLKISRDDPIVHMAAIMPNAENRDKFILIEKCWTDQQVLLQDFGCSKSELSYVYANGEPNHSPRFSLRVPDWSVEFKCDVIYCETDCEVTCGNKKRKRFSREAENSESSDGDLSTTPQPEIDSDLSTTESVYMPLETTASMIDEIEAEIWNSEKEKFDTKTKLTIKFGPFEWVNIETTPQPETDTETTPAFEMEIIDFEIQTKETEIEEIEEEIETISEVLDEIEKEIENVDEEILDDEESGVPGAIPLLVIAGSALVAFLSGFLLVVKYKCRNNQPKLLN